MDQNKNSRQKRKAVIDNKKQSAKKPKPPIRSSTNETITPLANVTKTRNHDVNLTNPTHIHTHGTSSNFIRNWNATLRQIASNEPNPAFDNCSSDGQSASDDEQDIEEDDQQGYFDIGDPIWECQQCGAFIWYQERKNKRKNSITPQFQLCCHGGKAQLPLLDQPPELLQHLLFNYHSADNKNYQAHTRIYNSMFAFTSPGMKLDETKRIGRGPLTLRIQGQVCHQIGSMFPVEGQPPKFAQLYIYDTENEIKNRMQNFRNIKELDENIVRKLKVMLDEHNVHARSFRMTKQTLQNNYFQDLKFKLISERTTDGRIYNKPTVSEVAARIVGDIDSAAERDIIMHKRSGQLKRINEFHPAYLAYQYPLIFPYGEDGFRTGIQFRYRHETEITKRNRLTIKDWLCFRIQKRKKEAQTLLCSTRLFQQFLVDGYTMMETGRLNWLRKNQSKLRVGKYHKLKEGTQNPNNDPNQKRGTRVILLVVKDTWINYTLMVFKIKFDELMKDLTKRHILGKVLAYMYTIEFQKRGLPHAHILIFLHPSSKYPSPEDIDTTISVEIPNPDVDPELYNLVKKHMIHGPCGPSRLESPCTVNGRCTKFFPKKFNEKTIVDQDGYPVYRRSSNSYTVEKNGVTLDNGYVVPYNKRLLLKYQAHINMEWCNQSSSIKYLFKYIHKGYDRITTTVERAQNNGANQ
ncbi:helicase-like protein [Trifolium pratense]|uniref:Helicase-like protein n=1 Tax=Trifolium pratense TaxID=57577 RepID=A0A2K3N2W5_TRIPR|nr:helicase-like protein [Trifolium pratense]